MVLVVVVKYCFDERIVSPCPIRLKQTTFSECCESISQVKAVRTYIADPFPRRHGKDNGMICHICLRVDYFTFWDRAARIR